MDIKRRVSSVMLSILCVVLSARLASTTLSHAPRIVPAITDTKKSNQKMIEFIKQQTAGIGREGSE